MLGALGFSLFRFRRRRSKIIAVYESFAQSEKRGLHPIEISKTTGLHMLDVIEVIDGVPELFLKLPSGQVGVTKYGLRPSISAQSHAEIIAFVNRSAKRDTYIYYALIAVVVNALVVVLFSTYPYFRTFFGA